MAMRKEGIDTVIATGDDTNSGDDNYAVDLAKIAKENRMNVIWVRGNHDNDKVMGILNGAKDKYYYEDLGNTRIVALDDVESDGSYQGSIDDKQLAWLESVLKTDKQVIVAMHIPVFAGGTVLNTDGTYAVNLNERLDIYSKLEDILHENNNVKIVLSGHWHLPWQREYNGINYYGQSALTREDYKGSYGVIDLKNDSVNYLFAR